MAQHTNVHEAINAVMQEVGYVQKQRSQGLNYSYAGEAALIGALRPWMVENEIVVHPSGVSGLAVEQFTNKNGTMMTHVTGMFSFTFVHAPSQSSFTVTVMGEGMDSGDKAANKAMTAAYKYALRQTFMIETGDDPDATPSSEYERTGRSGGSSRQQPEPAREEPHNGTHPERLEDQWADLIPRQMAELSGQELYFIQQNAWEYIGMDHPKHFENRWKKRYPGVKTLKEIPGTVGEFLMAMADEVANNETVSGEELFPGKAA